MKTNLRTSVGCIFSILGYIVTLLPSVHVSKQPAYFAGLLSGIGVGLIYAGIDRLWKQSEQQGKVDL